MDKTCPCRNAQVNARGIDIQSFEGGAERRQRGEIDLPGGAFAVLLAAFAASPGLAERTAPPAALRTLPAPARAASVEGITEYRLGNGLKVLMFPDPGKTTITVNVTCLVGSRKESYGGTGMAHLLEHLVFKGTEKFSGENGTRTPVDTLNNLEASFNGTTFFDYTNHFETFPASDANLDQVLDLEAERMGRCLLRAKDLCDLSTWPTSPSMGAPGAKRCCKIK